MKVWNISPSVWDKEPLRKIGFYMIIMAAVATLIAVIELEDGDHFWKYYLGGALLGIIAGPLTVWSTKEKIVEGKYICNRGWTLNYRTSWRRYLAIVIGAVIIFLAGDRLDSTGSFGLVTGLFAGMAVYFYVWVLIYEKRHNVRVTIEYQDF